MVCLAVTVAAMGATTDRTEDGNHWAFQPPKKVAPPKVRNSGWGQTEIDRFILAKLEAAGMAPAPPADARTLIRRMSLDLTGLPPSYDEVVAFIAASGQDRERAIAQMIDRLLASPRYGERWGRHWLDVARYSDTKGYVYAREERRFVHAPAYRDWVIGAFNQDLPYDRFLTLQIAADQLVSTNSPDLRAMGFVTGGRRFLGVTHDIIDDRIDVVTRGTMALTVSCARCHNHKYDPIPTQDYYSLYGVFHGSDERLIPLAAPQDKELATLQLKFAHQLAKRRNEANARLRASAGDYLAAQLELKNYPEEGFDQILSTNDLIPFSVRRWRDFLRQTQSASHPIFAPWHALATLEGMAEADFESAARLALAPVLASKDLNRLIAVAFCQPVTTLREAATRYGKVFTAVEERWKMALAQADQSASVTKLSDEASEEIRRFLYDENSPTVVPDSGLANTEYFFPTTVCEELWKLESDVNRRMIALGIPAALVLQDRPPEPNPRVFKRGSPSRPGEEVPRRFLAALSDGAREPFRQGSGRLELARAIANPDNPLTARVMVNRIWQHHFGAGLVKTPSDFGLRAEGPSHPELLDWLARRFVSSGWSIKAMHRLILSSAVYQQQTTQGEPNQGPAEAAVDPENRLLAFFPMHRLDFEQIRDSMLGVSDELDLELAGNPAELLDQENRRRTVYGFVDRQFLPGVFRTFDFANPDIHVAVRHETSVPQQGLFFLNGHFAASRARALAEQVTDTSPERRVQRFYQRLYQRPASDGEVAAALRFVQAAEADPAPVPPVRRSTQWRYGTGEYDQASQRLRSFTPLTHFTGSAWQGAVAWPGGETGWAQLTAAGGHPGNSRAQACVRRWVAPRDLAVQIHGKLIHEPEAGDGVRGYIVASGQGELKAAQVHMSKAAMTATNVVVNAGDTIDFIVDIGGTLNNDQFLWEPIITADGFSWSAREEFDGPRPAPQYLKPWEQYAQVLLLANEFSFVD
ncbi:MAG: DUF1549 and DUF1553 domain-containing protein [Verrucomicrobiota bacterium]